MCCLFVPAVPCCFRGVGRFVRLWLVFRFVVGSWRGWFCCRGCSVGAVGGSPFRRSGSSWVVGGGCGPVPGCRFARSALVLPCRCVVARSWRCVVCRFARVRSLWPRGRCRSRGRPFFGESNLLDQVLIQNQPAGCQSALVCLVDKPPGLMRFDFMPTPRLDERPCLCQAVGRAWVGSVEPTGFRANALRVGRAGGRRVRTASSFEATARPARRSRPDCRTPHRQTGPPGRWLDRVGEAAPRKSMRRAGGGPHRCRRGPTGGWRLDRAWSQARPERRSRPAGADPTRNKKKGGLNIFPATQKKKQGFRKNLFRKKTLHKFFLHPPPLRSGPTGAFFLLRLSSCVAPLCFVFVFFGGAAVCRLASLLPPALLPGAGPLWGCSRVCSVCWFCWFCGLVRVSGGWCAVVGLAGVGSFVFRGGPGGGFWLVGLGLGLCPSLGGAGRRPGGGAALWLWLGGVGSGCGRAGGGRVLGGRRRPLPGRCSALLGGGRWLGALACPRWRWSGCVVPGRCRRGARRRWRRWSARPWPGARRWPWAALRR